MSDPWTIVLLTGVATVALKATGPVLLGGRELPRPVLRVVELLAPALLAAFVAVQTFGAERDLVLDARVVGVGVAALALAARAPILVVVMVAAVATALARALGS